MTSFNSNIHNGRYDKLCERHGKELVERIISAVLSRVDDLPINVNLTSHQILGEDLWSQTDPAHHKTYGMLLAELVRAGLLPFKSIGKNGANHRLYRLDKNNLLKIA
mgnify:CR=1 FL=1